ncbi:MAG: DUF3352 domain-containing protein [Actinomycetota bacterium]|nr:DUF3352 domain-containing protein [Actinomycetota bacterium]
MKKTVIAIVVAGALVAAGVGYATLRLVNGTPAEDSAIELVPDDAWLYANLFIEPSDDQKRALDALLQRFPKVKSTEQALDELAELFNEGLDDIGLTYEDDVEPWLGNQVAFFLSGDDFEVPDGAALLATDDPEAAAEAIEKARASDEFGTEPETKTYEGVEYEVDDDDAEVPFALGFVEDFLVAGTEVGFQAVVDASTDEENLSTSEKYENAFEGVEDDNLLSLFLDQGVFAEELAQSGELSDEEIEAISTIPGFEGVGGFVLAARSDGLMMQGSTPIPEGRGGVFASASTGTPLLGEMPADAWFAVGIPEIGKLIKAFLETVSAFPGDFTSMSRDFEDETGLDLEDDVLSWMGDLAFFVQGTNFQEIGGGVVLESSDPDATQRVLDRARTMLEIEGIRVTDEERDGHRGFAVSAGIPAPIFALAADRLVIAYGNKATDDAIAPEDKLGDDPTFQLAEAALGGDLEPSFFVNFEGVVELIEFAQGFGGVSPDPTYQRDVRPWLDPISFVVAGSRRDGDRLIQGLFVGVDTEEVS